VIKLLNCGTDVADPEQRFDIVWLDGQGLVVERKRTLDVPSFSKMKIGQVADEIDSIRGECDGAFEVTEGLIRRLQEAIQVPQIVVGRCVVRADRQQRFEQLNGLLRTASSRQAAGLAEEGVRVALPRVLGPGLEGVEHLARQVVRRIDFQGPQVTFTRPGKVLAIHPEVSEDEQGLHVSRIEL